MPVLVDGLGFQWDFDDYGTVRDGTSDAYDGGMVHLGYFPISPTTFLANGREFVTAPISIGDISIYRQIYVPSDQGYARFLEVVTNNGTASANYTVPILTDLGSDGFESFIATSSGDAVFTPADQWIVTDDSPGGAYPGGDPVITHVVSGFGSIRPTTTQYGETPFVGVVSYSYDLSLASGETRIIMHFGAQGTSGAEAIATANALRVGGLGSLAGLSGEQIAQIANFSFFPVSVFDQTGSFVGGFDTIAEGLSVAQSGYQIIYRNTGPENVAIALDNLTFGAAAAGLTLTLAPGVADITLSDGAPIEVVGNALNNTIMSGAGHTIRSGAGNDTIILNGTPAAVDGGPGSDTVRVIGNVTVAAGSISNIEAFEVGDESTADLSALAVGAAITLISTATGGANVIGTQGADVIAGGAGDDTIEAGAGDTIAAGAGDDLITLDGSPAAVDGGAGTATDTVRVAGSVTFTAGNVSNIESFEVVDGGNADFSAFVAGITIEVLSTAGLGATAAGGAGDDIVISGFGDDHLLGGGGNDVLFGGEGVDTLRGGAGNDSYNVDQTSDSVVELAGEGVDTVFSTAPTYTLPDNVERGFLLLPGALMLVGNAGANTLGGNQIDNLILAGAGDDVIFGGAGDDTLYGETGNDILIGGPGIDRMIGGEGDDVYSVDHVLDIVSELSGNDIVYSTVSYALPSGIETAVLFGFAQTLIGADIGELLIGNAADNLILAGGGDDTVYGYGGDDYLNGQAGDDTLVGGDDDDVYVVDSIGDQVIEGSGGGFDQVYTSAGGATALEVEMTILTGGATMLTGGAGGETLVGNALANTLSGGAGDDAIFGYGGDDTIEGGPGLDNLIGGGGADIFVIQAPGEGIDFIGDFLPGADHVQLTAPAFGLGSGLTPGVDFIASANAAPSSNVPTLLYDTGTGILSFDADGTGAAVSTDLAGLLQAPNLTAADFLLV